MMSVVDWAAVVPAAITGAVGIAGVIGTITAAKIGAKAATENARLADKRRVYARSIAALDASVAATKAERVSKAERGGRGGPGHRTYDATAGDALLAAADAMGELQLAAPPRIADLADRAAKDLHAFRYVPLTPGLQPQADEAGQAIAETRQSLFDALRADLDDEAKRTG
jgi:hypothetical protein